MKTRVTFMYLLVFSVLLEIGALSALAHPSENNKTEATKEDLTLCKLPNGVLVLSDRNTPEGSKGNFLRFSDLRLSKDPFLKEGKQAPSIESLFERLRKEHVGDIFYSALNQGTLIAINGRIRNEGRHYLHEFDGKLLVRPELVEGIEEKSADGEGTPGAIEGIHAGNCYLLETVDGKFVLLRVVQILPKERSVLIQYIYQPDGTRNFEIPKGKIEKVASASNPKPTSPQPLPKKITSVYTLIDVRDKMIKSLINIINKQPGADTGDKNKAAAIDALGSLRASEAAYLLAQEIDFEYTFGIIEEVTIEGTRPCVKALEKIGKPGSLAVLEAAKKIRIDKPEASFSESPWETKVGMKLYLYAVVINNIESPEVAVFMIKQQIQTASKKEKESLKVLLTIITDILQ